jgi:formiminotetrahydrofolate cyclodeaminase
LCARTAVRGAYLNVQINTGDLDDKTAVDRFLSQGLAIQTEAQEREARILAVVQEKF